VVNGYRELLLGLFLPNHVLVEEGLDLLWLWKLVWSGRCRGRRAVIFQNGITNCDALVANIGSRIVARRGDQLSDSVLRFVAERAAKNFFSSGLVFHSAPLLLAATSGWLVSSAILPPDFLRRELPEA